MSRSRWLVTMLLFWSAPGCGEGEGEVNEGDGWSSPTPGGEGLREPGEVTTSTLALPSGMTNACEAPWSVRLLAYHPGRGGVPRKMYFASCTPPGGPTRMYTSVSVIPAGATEETDVSGLVTESQLDPVTGALVPTGIERAFPACEEMHGIAAKSDCSVIGVLCRRASRASESSAFTKDLVAELADTSEGGVQWWLTQPGSSAEGEQLNGEEWLYEWTTGSLADEPAAYVAHKAIGGWNYGSQYLVYGEADDSWGLSLKATVYGGGAWHQGDAMLVIDRSTHSLDLSRGWHWGCAAGHTIFNHPTYNAATSKYAVHCGTDLGIDETMGGGYGGVWLHVEDGPSQGYQQVPIHGGISIGGGPTSVQPLPDGGFLGVLAGVSGTFGPDWDYQTKGPVTEIGLARFDATGALVGDVTRVVARPGVFLSYPQLAPLGDGTFLLGYGEMVALADQNDWGLLRVPASYHVLEIDQDGRALTEERTLDDVGWGEQDQMIALGQGRVAWTYTSSPARDGSQIPACARPELALTVYAKQ